MELILILAVAGLVTTMVFKPSREAAIGAWREGSAEAAEEFRQGYRDVRGGYDRAQGYLRRPVTGRDGRTYRAGPRNLRWWLGKALTVAGGTALTAGGVTYGAYRVARAAARVGRSAIQGGRRRYRAYQDSRVIDVPDEDVLLDDVEDAAVRPRPRWDAPDEAAPETPADAEPPAPETAGPDPGPDPTNQEGTTMSEDLVAEANSLAALKGALAGEIAAMDQRVATLDSLMASLSGQGLDAETINGVSAYQDTISGAREQVSALLQHVEARHNQVAEAIQAAGGSENVANDPAFYDEA